MAEGLAGPLLARGWGARSCLEMHAALAAAVELSPTRSLGHTRRAGRDRPGALASPPGADSARGPSAAPT